MVPVTWYLWLAAILFTIGLSGVLVKRNALIVMMSVELMLNAANLTFLAFARQFGDVGGHAIAFFVIAVAAAEAAVGLAIVIAIYRTRGTHEHRRGPRAAGVRRGCGGGAARLHHAGARRGKLAAMIARCARCQGTFQTDPSAVRAARTAARSCSSPIRTRRRPEHRSVRSAAG